MKLPFRLPAFKVSFIAMYGDGLVWFSFYENVSHVMRLFSYH